MNISILSNEDIYSSVVRLSDRVAELRHARESKATEIIVSFVVKFYILNGKDRPWDVVMYLDVAVVVEEKENLLRRGLLFRVCGKFL